MGDDPSELEDEQEAGKGDNSLPGGDQVASETVFETIVRDEATATDPDPEGD